MDLSTLQHSAKVANLAFPDSPPPLPVANNRRLIPRYVGVRRKIPHDISFSGKISQIAHSREGRGIRSTGSVSRRILSQKRSHESLTNNDNDRQDPN